MRLIRFWRSWPAGAFDAVVASVFAAVSMIPALGAYGLALGELPVRPADGWHIALVLAQTLPLAVRRIAPGSCLAVVGTTFGFDQSLGYPPTPAGLGILFALYSAGAHGHRHRMLTVAASGLGYLALAVVLALRGSPERPWEFATFALILAAAWGVGDLVRVRGIAARARAGELARAAVFEERARIARELHDVVSHHVTGMVVLADAASFLLPAEEEQVRRRLGAIADGGRSALADLRRLLEVLGSNDPATIPAIGTLGELVAQARRAGQSVELEEVGQPAGSDELRLAVYRVAQEGLTNARKHAPQAATGVRVDWEPPEVQVRLITYGAARASRRGPTTAGSGRGLAGLAERVDRLGGRFRAAPGAEGAFVLEATIPLQHSGEAAHG